MRRETCEALSVVALPFSRTVLNPRAPFSRPLLDLHTSLSSRFSNSSRSLCYTRLSMLDNKVYPVTTVLTYERDCAHLRVHCDCAVSFRGQTEAVARLSEQRHAEPAAMLEDSLFSFSLSLLRSPWWIIPSSQG